MGTTESKQSPTLVDENPRQVDDHDRNDCLFTPVEHESIFQYFVIDVINDPFLPLSFGRRVALLESIRRQNDDLVQVVLEGILTCPRLSEQDKHNIVTEGLLEHRWDTVLDQHSRETPVVEFFDNDFLNYRRMILVLLRTSRKFQSLPETSRQKLKAIILQIDSKTQLDNFLARVLERTCCAAIKCRIMEDVASHRYYRLLWPDRLDCDEGDDNSEIDDRRLSSVKPGISERSLIYGTILLPRDLSCRQDCCPICLEPVHAPALKLSCQHMFCSVCISGWIRTEEINAKFSTFSGRPATSEGSTSHVVLSTREQKGWHCPVCRQSYLSSGK